MIFFFMKSLSNFFIFVGTYVLVFICLYFLFNLSQLKYRYQVNYNIKKSGTEYFYKLDKNKFQNFDADKIQNQIQKFIGYSEQNYENFYKNEISKQFKDNYISFRKEFSRYPVAIEFISNLKINNKVSKDAIDKLFITQFFKENKIRHKNEVRKIKNFLNNNDKRKNLLIENINWISQMNLAEEYFVLLQNLYINGNFHEILKIYSFEKTTKIEQNRLIKSLFYSFFISFFLLIIIFNLRQKKT